MDDIPVEMWVGLYEIASQYEYFEICDILLPVVRALLSQKESSSILLMKFEITNLFDMLKREEKVQAQIDHVAKIVNQLEDYTNVIIFNYIL